MQQKKNRAQGGDAADDVSGITPSITSSSALLSSTLSVRLGEFNDDEQMKQDLDSLGIGEEITTDPAMEQV